MNRKILNLLLGCLLMATQFLYSQVGINTESPYSLTDLQIKNVVENGTDTIPKGIMIPRLTEKQRDAITISSSTDANSLMIYNTTEDCYNYYSRSNNEWQSLCGKLGKATFTLDCSSLIVGGKGTYSSKIPLDGSHYLQMKVNVTKAGSYNITAMPDPTNGYYFTLSGEFLSTGEYTLIVPGSGTPNTPTADQDDVNKGDLIKITLNGIDSDCSTTIHIIDSTIKPVFTMNCASTKPSGIYKIQTELDATNYISVTINGDISAGTGAKAVLKTDVVDGMQFISNPTEIIGGIQTIILYGTGAPQSAGTKTFKITSNSTSSSVSCNASLNVLMKPKRILSIGYRLSATDATYGYRFDSPGYAGGTYDFTHDARNFGDLNTSIIPIEKLDIIGLGPTITASDITPYLSGPQKVDMIVIAYSTGWTGTDVPTLLGEYVKNGNPLVLFADNNVAAGGTSSNVWSSLMTSIFDGSTSNVTVESLRNSANTLLTPGGVFRLTSYNHPVLNGPFGDVRNLYWGEDASVAQVALGLPNDEVIILSDVTDVSTPNFTPLARMADGATGFVHRKYPFIFFGDGGFTSHYNAFSSTAYPFKLNAINFPAPNNNYGRGSNTQSVFNSTIFANAIAWGLRIVEGIEVQ